MRIISETALTALVSKRFTARALVKMHAANDDPLCLWDDRGNISYGGDVYKGATGRFKITPSASVSDLSVRNLSILFSGLDSEIIARIDGVDWHQQPIEISRAIILTDAPQLLNVTPEYVGFMDKIVWKEGGKGRPSTLTLSCESVSREYSRSGSRTASDADQRQRDPDDGFFSFAASAVSTSVDWGQSPQTAPKQKSGGILGLISKIF